MMWRMNILQSGILSGVLLLSSCAYVQQWQAAKDLEESYAEYVERCESESAPLTELKKAAAKAVHAQIRITWDKADKADTIIPLGAAELAAIQEMMPRMQDKPALCREAWEKSERAKNQPPTFVSHTCYPYLEFLDAEGEELDDYPLDSEFGVCENAEKYRRRFSLYSGAFMLPAADLAKFKALPAMQKYEKAVRAF